ncbi:MAG: helix-turn-helix domain-containing protein [Bacteroidales bacterium]|nr:helix-turn-helix domain-containing protein [Bacteroidales bacterium]
MDIGRKISELRQEKGLTQRDLSEHLGVSSGAVGMWETGKRQPDPETINKLADYFEVSIDYLFGREANNSSDLAVPDEEIEELLGYYAALDKMSQRWIMGKMVELLRRGDGKSVAADKPSSLKEVK